MRYTIVKMLMAFAAFSLLCAGCVSADGGEIVGGVLQGIGTGLSGL